MTAQSDSLEALLGVQAHDLVIDQLRYRRDSLVERQELRTLRQEQGRLAVTRDATRARLRDQERVQRRLEDEVSSIEAKAMESESRLYGGVVQAPKELQALASEVESLRARKRGREDELLEVMESLEELTAEMARLAGDEAELVRQAEERTATLATHEREIDDELAVEATAREELGAAVPGDLLATYERLRARLDGVGIARVDGGRCTGCHLSLSAVERDSLRRSADGEVVLHEECGRLLVA